MSPKPGSAQHRHPPQHQHEHAHARAPPGAPAHAPAKDPVCGMSVDPQTARHSLEHAGQTWYFCSARCRERFAATPETYLPGGPATPTPGAAGIIYTCPMHPEVRQVGPGFCPICGMALEPAEVEESAGPNPELVDMTRRFAIGLVLAPPVFRSEE